ARRRRSEPAHHPRHREAVREDGPRIAERRANRAAAARHREDVDVREAAVAAFPRACPAQDEARRGGDVGRDEADAEELGGPGRRRGDPGAHATVPRRKSTGIVRAISWRSVCSDQLVTYMKSSRTIS